MKRRAHLSLTVIAIVILLIFARGWFERGIQIIQRPLAQAGTWFYKQPNKEELERRLVALSIDKAKYEQLIQENQELKEVLGYIERSDLTSIMATIIARSNTIQTSTFSIDRGEQDGIKVGDPVIVKDGVLIGKVISVTQKSSTVRTLSDPAVATAVSLLNQSQTIGVAEGMAGNLLKLNFIPQETVIEIDNLVVTSGLEPRIPSGLLVGIINDVRPEPNAPFLEAVIEPLVDSRLHTSVQVLIQKEI
jgi:rod shape-determining protein MreC